MTRVVTVVAPSLYPLQAKIAADPTRFRVVATGRRAGKTKLGAWESVRYATEGKRVWWVAPTYSMAQVGWREIIELSERLPGVRKEVGAATVRFPGGGSIAVRSGVDPDRLRGEGLDFAVLDEAAYLDSRVWFEAVRPALSDRRGRALLLSSPAGRNWFYSLWVIGERGGDPSWSSWRFPTSANPFIDRSEVEQARADLPDVIFRQEYLAEFVEDSSLVFGNVRQLVTGEGHQTPRYGGRYVAGIDWGQMNDYTAVVVVDETIGYVAYAEAFRMLPWSQQQDRVAAILERYDVVHALVEGNSIGRPNLEALQERGLPVSEFITSNRSKARIIQNLAVSFERREVTLCPNEELLEQLEAFEASRTPTGLWAYSAPEGKHDDLVIALALAVWAMSGGVRVDGIPPVVSEWRGS